MNIVLLVLGVLGLGAVLIAAYVFTVAARSYVSEEQNLDVTNIESAEPDDEKRAYVVRSIQDRRQFTGKVVFPLRLPSGNMIEMDRRRGQDRRVVSR